MNKKITLIVTSLIFVVIIVTCLVVLLNKKEKTSTDKRTTDQTTYVVSGEKIELTQVESTDETVVWSAKLVVSTGGHSLKIKEINQKTGTITLLHRKPGARCVVTQAFETLEVTFELKKSVSAKTEILEATYDC